jgi:hypothetical protein
MRGYSQEEFEKWTADRGIGFGLGTASRHLAYPEMAHNRCSWTFPRSKAWYRGFLNSLLRAAAPQEGFFVYFATLRGWTHEWDRRWFAALDIPLRDSGFVYFRNDEPLLRISLCQQLSSRCDLDVIPDHAQVIVGLTNDLSADVRCRDWNQMKSLAFKMAGRYVGLPDTPYDVASVLRQEYLAERGLRGSVNLLLDRR